MIWLQTLLSKAFSTSHVLDVLRLCYLYQELSQIPRFLQVTCQFLKMLKPSNSLILQQTSNHKNLDYVLVANVVPNTVSRRQDKQLLENRIYKDTSMMDRIQIKYYFIFEWTQMSVQTLH